MQWPRPNDILPAASQTACWAMLADRPERAGQRGAGDDAWLGALLPPLPAQRKTQRGAGGQRRRTRAPRRAGFVVV